LRIAVVIHFGESNVRFASKEEVALPKSEEPFAFVCEESSVAGAIGRHTLQSARSIDGVKTEPAGDNVNHRRPGRARPQDATAIPTVDRFRSQGNRALRERIDVAPMQSAPPN
jgi:hypothetical protein